MPGLLRGIARTAVVAGTASAVAGRVQRHQAEKFADRDAAIYAQQDRAYQQASPQPVYQQPPVAPPPAAPVLTRSPRSNSWPTSRSRGSSPTPSSPRPRPGFSAADEPGDPPADARGHR